MNTRERVHVSGNIATGELQIKFAREHGLVALEEYWTARLTRLRRKLTEGGRDGAQIDDE